MNEPLIPGGFIVVARRMIESEIWEKPPLYIKVWMFLLIQAQHKPYKGLKRGQLSTSIPEIIEAVAWRVGARKERPTKDQIFQILDWLRSTKTQRSPDESNAKATMITTTKATQSMLINVDGYCYYQDISNYESNDESNGENPTKPARKQREPDNTNKNVKNDKNEKNDNKVKEEVIKEIYAEKVSLSIPEYERLIIKYGNEENVKWGIEKLSIYKCSKKTKYTSDYHVLIGWVFEDFEKRKLTVLKGGQADVATTESRGKSNFSQYPSSNQQSPKASGQNESIRRNAGLNSEFDLDQFIRG